MNQKAFSIFFCVLLGSTFVHEIRAKAAALPNLTHQIQKRSADPILNCDTVCTDTNTAVPAAPLSLLVNAAAGLAVVVNTTANTALIVDINVNLVALLDGVTGLAIIINIDTGNVYCISHGVWLVANQTIQVFVASLTNGLAPLLNTVGGILYIAGQVIDSVLLDINLILCTLIVNIELQLKADLIAGLQLCTGIANKLIVLLNGVLKGLLELVGDLVITLTCDLANLVSILDGLADVCGQVVGGLAAVVAAGVNLNLSILLALNDGISVLVELIGKIGVKLDIGVILGPLCNDVEGFFKLVAKLGGNKNTGLAGLIKAVANIVLFVNGHLEIEVLISRLIQFLAITCQTVTVDLSVVLNQTLQALLNVIVQVNASVALAGLVNTITLLLNGTLIVAGCNISNIIQILINGVLGGVDQLLTVLCSVILALTAVISAELGLLNILLCLIFQVNTPYGIELLKCLGISITLTETQILGGAISCILSLVLNVVFLLLGDLYTALLGLPCIGGIVTLLDAAIQTASGGLYNIQALLNGSSLYCNLIRGLFQLLTGLPLLISITIVNQVKALYCAATSLNNYLCLDFPSLIGVLL